jgi:hypothetical protein
VYKLNHEKITSLDFKVFDFIDLKNKRKVENNNRITFSFLPCFIKKFENFKIGSSKFLVFKE